jgi:hypothetical protein
MTFRGTGPGRIKKLSNDGSEQKVLLFNFDFDDMQDPNLKLEHMFFLEREIVPQLVGKNTHIFLRGLASRIGADDYNLRLSRHRVDKVVKLLWARGVLPIQIQPEAVGSRLSTSTLIDDEQDRGVILLVQAAVTPVPPPEPPTIVAIATVKFWMNAFIPGSIPGLTRVLTKGPFTGKTVIPGPPLSKSFLTDNRGFSDVISASSRMHSEFEVRFTSFGPRLDSRSHKCDASHEIDESTGTVVGTATGTTGRMNFTMRTPRGSSVNFVEVDMKCAANNPLVATSPDIDYVGTITIDPTVRKLELDAKIDDFPAFEAYCNINGGDAAELFTEPPPPGNSPFDLFGPAKRPVKRRIEDRDGDGNFETLTVL